MGFDFHFHGLQDRTDLQELVNFLVLQDLGYPRYDEWVQRAEHELDTGYKKTILAFSGGELVGDVIYQQHKEISCFLELKNLRIHPELRTRKFAEFMLKQVEAENKQYDAIICDLPSNQPKILNFMESQGYSILTTIPLYDKNVPDIVMMKFLNPETKQLLLSTAKNIIYRKAS